MEYDIIIIGAGPAGSTFARLAAGNGKKILLVNKQTGKNTKPCGGLLAPDAQKILAYFDLPLPKSILVDPQIFSVKTVDICKNSTRYYPRHYLNMDRYAFDSWLLSLVPDDVEVLQGICTGILRKENLFELEICSGSNRAVVYAKHVIGADGAGSLIRKKFFTSRIKQYTAIQQWFNSSDETNPFYSCIFDRETSESCSWSINKNGYFIYGGCFGSENSRASFEKQKERISNMLGFKFDTPLKTEACIVYSPRRMRDFITGEQGVYLIGEAAGFISPSSFEGISGAVESASLLARAFNETHDDNVLSKKYKRSTFRLKIKFRLKVIKRWFMYNQTTRYFIMKSGIGSISPLIRKQM